MFKHSLTLFLSLSILSVAGLNACKDGKKMSATVTTREGQGQAAQSEPTAAGVIKPEDTSLPKSGTNTADESPSIPGVITGALLVCLSDPKTDAKAKETSVSCALKQPGGTANVDLAKDYASHQWGAAMTSDLAVSFVELSSTAAWQVKYTVKSVTTNDIRTALQGLRFTLDTIDAKNKTTKLTAETNVLLPESPDDQFLHLKNEMERCLDLSHGIVTAGTDFLTYGCNPAATNQLVSFNANMQLTINGACLVFTDKGNSVVGPCTGPSAAPSWIVSGNKIQMWNSSLCLGSGAGVGRVVSCNAAELTQQWVIGRQVLNKLPSP